MIYIHFNNDYKRLSDDFNNILENSIMVIEWENDIDLVPAYQLAQNYINKDWIALIRHFVYLKAIVLYYE